MVSEHIGVVGILKGGALGGFDGVFTFTEFFEYLGVFDEGPGRHIAGLEDIEEIGECIPGLVEAARLTVGLGEKEIDLVVFPGL